MLSANDAAASLLVKRVGDEACTLMYFGALLHEAAFANRERRADAEDIRLLTEHFFWRRLSETNDPGSQTYLDRISAISGRI